MVAREGAVRSEGVFLLQLGAATVVLEDEVDPGDSVIAGGNGLVAGLLAAIDERDVAQGLGCLGRRAKQQGQRHHKGLLHLGAP